MLRDGTRHTAAIATDATAWSPGRRYLFRAWSRLKPEA